MEQEISSIQTSLYKTLIKRWIFDGSDEIEIRLPLLNCPNILEYIWWLLNSNQPHPKDIARNLQNVVVKRLHLLKSQKYWNCKVLLGIIIPTITQLNYLFVLSYWSFQCRHLIKLLMKWVQYINNYQKSYNWIIIIQSSQALS